MISNLLPIGGAIAADIRDLKQSGVLLPVRKNDPTLLITDWGGTINAIFLTGPQDFIFFPVTIKHSRTGLFIPVPEIVIDYASAVTGIGHDMRNGELLLEKDKLSIIATPVGNQFAEAQPVSLWPVINGGSDDAKVVFTKWAIGVRNGDSFTTLWERSNHPKATVAFTED